MTMPPRKQNLLERHSSRALCSTISISSCSLQLVFLSNELDWIACQQSALNPGLLQLALGRMLTFILR